MYIFLYCVWYCLFFPSISQQDSEMASTLTPLSTVPEKAAVLLSCPNLMRLVHKELDCIWKAVGGVDDLATVEKLKICLMLEAKLTIGKENALQIYEALESAKAGEKDRAKLLAKASRAEAKANFFKQQAELPRTTSSESSGGDQKFKRIGKEKIS